MAHRLQSFGLKTILHGMSRTNDEPKSLTYVKLSQTDGESSEKRFGDFVAQWQGYANGNRPDDFPESSLVRTGTNVAQKELHLDTAGVSMEPH